MYLALSVLQETFGFALSKNRERGCRNARRYTPGATAVQEEHR